MSPGDIAERLLRSIPTVDDTDEIADQTRDWPLAEYHTEVEAVHGGWRVAHRLTGAPGIESLIANGSAEFAVCLQSNRTVLSKTYRTAAAVTDVRIPPDSLRGDFYMTPGVVTTGTSLLDCTDTDWTVLSPIDVPAGRWLVKGRPTKITPKGFDPLRLRPNPDMDPRDRFSVRYMFDSDVYFIVEAHPEYLDHIRHGDPVTLMLCWAAVMAMLPSIQECSLEIDDRGILCAPSSKMADALVRTLSDKGIAPWGDGEGNTDDSWDPMAAASSWVKVGPYTTADEET